MNITDFWSVYLRQQILQRGDETQKYLGAKWGGTRLVQTHGHTEEEAARMGTKKLSQFEATGYAGLEDRNDSYPSSRVTIRMLHTDWEFKERFY